MQNTIIREFENNPQVLVVPLQEGSRKGETREWIEVFWRNYYLRNGLLWDESRDVSLIYEQPDTYLPFGRGFIIDQQGNVDTPFFGHMPQMVIDRIYELLDNTGVDELLPRTGSMAIRAWPNPFLSTSSSSINFDCEMPGFNVERIGIFDVRGRLIAKPKIASSQAQGGFRMCWDGLDLLGRPAGPGAYFVRVGDGRRLGTRRITLIQ